MNNYNYDKDYIKENLTIEQILKILTDFHGEPIRIKEDVIICKTICHNPQEDLVDASHKLYYYENSHLFHCYTGCAEPSFDIFELVRKVKEQDLKREYSLPAAVQYVAEYFGFSPANHFSFNEQFSSIEDFKKLEAYERIRGINPTNQTVELAEYDGAFLKNLPHPLVQPWLEEGITKEIMDYFEIAYNPKSCGIVIPHRDVEGRLIGIRERTLIKENADKYGKYMPMKLNGMMYNHPLSFNLYGLYQNQEIIKSSKRAIIFEGEKSVLKYGSLFGQEDNIAVAVCGSSFIQYQAWYLIKYLRVTEIVIALDKQYQQRNDDEHKKLVRNLKQINNKYGHLVKITYLFDKGNLLDYKDSPIDKGKEVFMELYKHKEDLYTQ